jgi:hypothetical protein
MLESARFYLPRLGWSRLMETYLTCIIALMGAGTMVGVFWRMESGFGPYNLRAVGIVLVATFAALLAMRDGSAMTAAMGILGGIAGYLFGIRDSPRTQ